MQLAGKRALVTGAAVRVGKAIALELARQGVHIGLHFGRSGDAAKQTQSELQALGVRAPLLQADLANAQQTAELLPAAAAALDGPIDILVNSAAVYLDGGLAETSLEMWDREFAINLRAPFQLSQAFAAQTSTPAGKDRTIVNILDARSNRPAADHFAYRLTKAGLDTMTKNLAVELAPAIRVNALALGAILPPPGASEGHLDRIAAERIPLQRAGNAELVAKNVVHLLTQDFLTGVVIPLDGGEFL